jgi:hypothetical protein
MCDATTGPCWLREVSMAPATLETEAPHEHLSLQPDDDTRLIERFIPKAQVRESHEIEVRAPADVVMDVAERFDLMSIPAVFAIFRLRSRIMGATPPSRDDLDGVVEATKRIGWVELARRPGRQLVMGAAVQPWLPAPVFEPVPPDRFLDYAEPDHVRIVWTFEAEPVGPSKSRFRTETRVEPTDETARRRFRWYWMRTGIGIVLIRWLTLPAIRREAERRARQTVVRDRCEAPLLDRFMPAFDATIVRETDVNAPTGVAYAAIFDTNLMDGVVRALFVLRELPARLIARLRRVPLAPQRRSITIDDLPVPETGMVRLAEDAGHEFLVGSVGRFWQADYGHRLVTAQAFATFDEPGYVKLAMDLCVIPRADGCCTLRYEARTAATDETARHSFMRYWRLIRPGVGLVMGRAITLIRKQAERRQREQIRRDNAIAT